MRARSLRRQDGFTLIEGVIATFVLIIGTLATVTMIDGANAATSATAAREAGTSLARELGEAARGVGYAQLTPQTIAGEIQKRPDLSDASSSGGWTIRRRGVTFSVAASVCSVDDPADGAGVRDSGSFCADNPPAGTADRDPDDYKRVGIDVTWTMRARTATVHRTELIDSPGTTGGPTVKTLAPTANPTTITSAVSSVAFSATTSSAPSTVSWSVDGSAQGTASGSSTSWSFNWPIATLVDGSYLVSARAYFRSGSFGNTRSVTITLNRYAPVAPTGFEAGRNNQVVELEWKANSERDIVGYRAYRINGSTVTEVCSLSKATDCRDQSPPATGSPQYFVVAVDRDPSGAYREGARSATATATDANTAPNPPTTLQASVFNDQTILRWTAPATPDPDAGDSIAFYRIYRDGVTYADRYDRTASGSILGYTDTERDGRAHTYAVTAVDTHLAESILLGPVTR